MGYLTNFIVYTLAMTGIIGIALLVFKFSSGNGCKNKSKYLKVLDTMSIGPRKTLYIISAGEEKFLIAGDVDKTSLISKLNSSKAYEENIPAVVSAENQFFATQSYQNSTPVQSHQTFPKKEDFTDKSVCGIRKNLIDAGVIDNNSYASVMKKLATKMQRGI